MIRREPMDQDNLFLENLSVLRTPHMCYKNLDSERLLLWIRREPVDQENLYLENPAVLRPSSLRKASP